jgi:two-component system CheB/CheR fusion protein
MVAALAPALSVLVVDDYPDAAESLARVLRLDGHDARAALGGDAAAALLEGWVPDVAVLDLRMPGVDGFALAERLRALPRPPLLVAVSGSALKADWARAAAAFDRHFLKPVDPHALAELLRGYAAR